MAMYRGASGTDVVSCEIGLLIHSSEEQTAFSSAHLQSDVVRRLFLLQRWMLQSTGPYPWVSRMGRMITLQPDQVLALCVRADGLRGSGGTISWGAEFRCSQRESDI